MNAPSPAIRVGIIGYGLWGPNHVRNFRSIGDCTVVRICDVEAGRLQDAKQQARGIETTNNVEDVVNADDIDAVIVATPVRTHFELVKRALQAGKDVLCEKPLAATPDECRVLCALAREKKRILMVGHVFLYNAGVLHLKADLERGDFGQLYYMDAVRTNLGPVRQDVGAIQDLASHDIAIFNFLLNAGPEQVSATGGSFLQAGLEDIGFLTLVYPQGIVCHVHTSWLNPRKVRQLTIVGNRRMAVWNDMDNLEPIRYHDRGLIAGQYASFGEFHMILRDGTGTITMPKIPVFEPLLRQDQEFIDCVKSRRVPVSDGEFGLGVAQVLAAAQKSLQEHGRMISVSSG